jgi:hypothetical protein
MSKEELAFRFVPQFTLEVIRRYLRIEVEGLEHLPATGPYIVVSNHSGYSGFDAIMLANEIFLAQKKKSASYCAQTLVFRKTCAGSPQKNGLVAADTQ